MKTSIFARRNLVFLGVSMGLAQQGIAGSEDENNVDNPRMEQIQIIGHSDGLRTEAGSATLVDESALEAFEYDDINQVLSNVPGVSIRQEDGYGLRPNIGFRGATPERSKKISLLEDGVLIGPAPYSAPAAYYFPNVSRMTAVEVFKGPAAIKYGPNTVAGALNMTTRAIPLQSEGELDVLFGTDNYNKLHAHFGETRGQWGYLIEGITLGVDGFKSIDGGGDSGFRQNDVMAKLRYSFDAAGGAQYIEAKFAYADEESNETYLGLTDQDFNNDPYRRYAATQTGKMEWEHQQIQLTHYVEMPSWDATTRLYRNDFERAWRKLNGFRFGTPSLQEILQDPELHSDYYQVLSGAQNSDASFQDLVVGTNDREYFSQGIQSDINWYIDTQHLSHQVQLGIRLHQDEIQRNHTEAFYSMESGDMYEISADTPTTTNTEETTALSLYLQDTVNWRDLEVTAGIRGEFMDMQYQNRADGKKEDWLDKDSRIWLPSLSAFYQLSESFGMLFGVHQGFVPTSPKQDTSIEHETSINYEFGGRYTEGMRHLELIGFYSDIENLKESCTLSTSSSCVGNGIDEEFNGGEVAVYGLEASMGYEHALSNGWQLPLSLVYTFTDSEFKQDFSSTFELWGDVEAGDEVPYLPEHQLTIGIGLTAEKWRAQLLTKYVGEMHEAAGDNVALSGSKTDALTVVDVSASYDIPNIGTIYTKIDNLFDTTEVISRRPFGARPNKPRQFFVGYKYAF
jgi:Fe(3+) dicitrate transport protein